MYCEIDFIVFFFFIEVIWYRILKTKNRNGNWAKASWCCHSNTVLPQIYVIKSSPILEWVDTSEISGRKHLKRRPIWPHIHIYTQCVCVCVISYAHLYTHMGMEKGVNRWQQTHKEIVTVWCQYGFNLARSVYSYKWNILDVCTYKGCMHNGTKWLKVTLKISLAAFWRGVWGVSLDSNIDLLKLQITKVINTSLPRAEDLDVSKNIELSNMHQNLIKIAVYVRMRTVQIGFNTIQFVWKSSTDQFTSTTSVEPTFR